MFLGELVLADADIAEENDVVFGEFLEFFGKGIDVIRSAAGAVGRVEEQSGEFDTRVAGEGVELEAVLQAGQGLAPDIEFLGQPQQYRRTGGMFQFPPPGLLIFIKFLPTQALQ